jgi:hypothetical protein
MRLRRLRLPLIVCVALIAFAAPIARAQDAVTTPTTPAQTTPDPAQQAQPQPAPGQQATPPAQQPQQPAPAPGQPGPAQTTPAGDRDGSGDTAAIVLLAVAGGLLIVGALTWALGRLLGWEPEWWLRARHATAEAGWRTSNAWSEFRDWVRLGR